MNKHTLVVLYSVFAALHQFFTTTVVRLLLLLTIADALPLPLKTFFTTVEEVNEGTSPDEHRRRPAKVLVMNSIEEHDKQLTL